MIRAGDAWARKHLGFLCATFNVLSQFSKKMWVYMSTRHISTVCPDNSALTSRSLVPKVFRGAHMWCDSTGVKNVAKCNNLSSQAVIAVTSTNWLLKDGCFSLNCFLVIIKLSRSAKKLHVSWECKPLDKEPIIADLGTNKCCWAGKRSLRL